MAHSGLQRSVLSLYKQCLLEIRKKPVVCPSVVALDVDPSGTLNAWIGASREFSALRSVIEV